MGLLRQIRRYARGLVWPLMLAGVTWYFGHYALHGQSGLVAMHQLDRDIAAARAEVDGLTFERDRLQRRAQLLTPQALDGDMLEEQARALDLGKPDEILIMPNADRSAPIPGPPPGAPELKFNH